MLQSLGKVCQLLLQQETRRSLRQLAADHWAAATNGKLLAADISVVLQNNWTEDLYITLKDTTSSIFLFKPHHNFFSGAEVPLWPDVCPDITTKCFTWLSVRINPRSTMSQTIVLSLSHSCSCNKCTIDFSLCRDDWRNCGRGSPTCALYVPYRMHRWRRCRRVLTVKHEILPLSLDQLLPFNHQHHHQFVLLRALCEIAVRIWPNIQ